MLVCDAVPSDYPGADRKTKHRKSTSPAQLSMQSTDSLVILLLISNSSHGLITAPRSFLVAQHLAFLNCGVSALGCTVHSAYIPQHLHRNPNSTYAQTAIRSHQLALQGSSPTFGDPSEVSAPDPTSSFPNKGISIKHIANRDTWRNPVPPRPLRSRSLLRQLQLRMFLPIFRLLQPQACL